jgi:glycosyltransferase involved in cell wall biosynthesis
VKLTFVARRYWPAHGGVEVYLRHLVHELATRHEVVVLAQRIDDTPAAALDQSVRPPAAFAAFEDHDVHVRHLAIPPATRMKLWPMAASALPIARRAFYGEARVVWVHYHRLVAAAAIARQVKGADVVHAFGGGDFLAATINEGAHRAGIPVVVTPFAHEGQWADDAVSAIAYRGSDRVVALLDTEAALYRHLGVDDQRLVVFGVCSPGVLGGDGQRVRTRYGITGPLVVFLGIQRPYKGVDILIAAAARLAVRHPDLTVAIVGPGTTAPTPAERGVVLDIGEVDDRERADWLAAADILCLPSSAEIFPESFLEAWSVALPVVCSNIPTLQELMSRSGGGVAVPRDAEAVAAAISALILDPARRHRLGESGRTFWKTSYTPGAVAARHEGLYASLAADVRVAI